jgi:ornithine cyclodeaminase/alanine dehydrogenase-like protein (mu-crystallin family)
MRLVLAAEIDAALNFPDLIDALSVAFRGGTIAPARHHHAIAREGADATHLLMPAWTAPGAQGGAYLGVKIVNVFPDNGARNLPAVLGTYILQSGETGAPLAAMDGTRLTHWRTAAASALAARFLARADARRLLIVGAGALAPFLARAHAAVRGIEEVTIWNHRAAGAEKLARTRRRKSARGRARRRCNLLRDFVEGAADRRRVAAARPACRSCRRLQSCNA